MAKDSSVYSGVTKKGQKTPANDFNSAKYALMIFDQKKNGFRLVPINRHLDFEKVKTYEPPKKVTQAPTIKGGIPTAKTAAPRKKAKDILKNFKSMLNKQKN